MPSAVVPKKLLRVVSHPAFDVLVDGCHRVLGATTSRDFFSDVDGVTSIGLAVAPDWKQRRVSSCREDVRCHRRPSIDPEEGDLPPTCVLRCSLIDDEADHLASAEDIDELERRTSCCDEADARSLSGRHPKLIQARSAEFLGDDVERDTGQRLRASQEIPVSNVCSDSDDSTSALSQPIVMLETVSDDGCMEAAVLDVSGPEELQHGYRDMAIGAQSHGPSLSC